MSPYFDGCYFDETYFDASPCVPPPASTLGRHVRGKRAIDTIPEEAPEDQFALIVLLL